MKKFAIVLILMISSLTYANEHKPQCWASKFDTITREQTKIDMTTETPNYFKEAKIDEFKFSVLPVGDDGLQYKLYIENKSSIVAMAISKKPAGKDYFDFIFLRHTVKNSNTWTNYSLACK